MDDVALQGDFKRFLLAAQHGQRHAAADLAAHLLDRLIEGQALHRLAIDLGDEITRLHAGLGRGRVIHRRHDLDQSILHGDFDAETAKLAFGLDLHVLVFLGIHIARMRIQRGQHAVDGGFDQFVILGRLDIGRAHALEHFAEQVELFIGVDRRRIRSGFSLRGAWMEGERADDHAGGEGGGDEERLAEHVNH